MFVNLQFWAHTVQSQTVRLVISDLLNALSCSQRLNCEGHSSMRSDRLKLNPHSTFCCRGGRHDWCPRSTAQEIYPDGNPSTYQPHPTVLNFDEQKRTFGASQTRRRVWAVSFGATNYEQCLHLSEWVTYLHIGVPVRNPFLRFAYPRV